MMKFLENYKTSVNFYNSYGLDKKVPKKSPKKNEPVKVQKSTK